MTKELHRANIEGLRSPLGGWETTVITPCSVIVEAKALSKGR